MERALAFLKPADAARRVALGVVGPRARSWLVNREKRVALTIASAVLFSFVLSITSPLALLALGPILLGVPHLFADVRYLVVGPGLHRRRELLLVLLPLIVVGVTAEVKWGWTALIAAALLAQGPLYRRMAMVALGGGFLLLSWKFGYWLTLAIAHFHNLFAVIVVSVWRRKRDLRYAIAPLLLFTAASAMILFGGVEGWMIALRGYVAPWTGLDFAGQAATLGPPTSSLPAGAGWIGTRLVIFYAFAQSVHYGIWLRAMPDQARRSRTARSFSQSARVLVQEMGIPVIAVTLVLALGLAVYAAVDLAEARNAYFRFALAHGYLEFSIFALFFCEGSFGQPADPELEGTQPSHG